MTRHRLRTDLNHLISWVLLASAATTIATGIIADAWDLNGFRTHTVAGYVMTVAAMAHVVMSWNRLVSYARFRLRRLRSREPVLRRFRPSTLGQQRRFRPSTLGQQRRFRPSTLGEGSLHPGRSGSRRFRGPATWAAPDASTGASPGADGGGALSRRRLFGIAATGAAGFVAGRGLRPPPVIPHGSDLGVVYHEWSKPGVTDALGTLASWGRKPPLYKRYDDAPHIALPDDPPEADMSLPDAIQRRRSTREYDARPLPLDQFATLARHAGGLRDDSTDRRTAPSSGALYPIEVYPIVHDVAGLDPGVYHYDVRGHGLSLLRAGAVGGDVMRYGLDQDFLATANVVFVLTLIHQRMRFKYRDRSYRYGLLEAGHLGQNLYLTATALGLGACAVGAFHDDGINGLLGVDGREEVAVYLLAAGNRRT